MRACVYSSAWPGVAPVVFKCSGQEVGVVRGVVTLLVNGQLAAIAIQLYIMIIIVFYCSIFIYTNSNSRTHPNQ